MSVNGNGEAARSSWQRPDAPLGTLIFREGLLSAEQLEDALGESVKQGKRLGQVLVERGLLEEAQVARILARQKGLQFVDLRETHVDRAAASLVSSETAWLTHAIPIAIEDGTPTVAVADPSDEEALKTISAALGTEPRFAVATRSEILRVLGAAFSEDSTPAAPPAVTISPEANAAPLQVAPGASAPDAPAAAPAAQVEPVLGLAGLRVAAPPPEPAVQPELAVQPEPKVEAAPAVEAVPETDAAVEAEPEPGTFVAVDAEPEPDVDAVAEPAADPVHSFEPVAPAPEPAAASDVEPEPLSDSVGREPEPVAPAPAPVPSVAVPTFAPREPEPSPAPRPVEPEPSAEPAPPAPSPVFAPAASVPSPPESPEPTAAPPPAPVVELAPPAPDPVPAASPDPVSAPPEPAPLHAVPVMPSPEPAAARTEPAPEPVPTAPAPVEPEPQPEPLPVPGAVAEPPVAVGRYRVVVRLTDGEEIETDVLPSAAEAHAAARSLAHAIGTAAPGEWPELGGRFVRPDLIVSVDVVD